MKHTKSKAIQVEQLCAITCDVCKSRYDDPIEYQQFVGLDKTAGYGSIFGDGATIRCDICQDCLKKLLGEYLRIENPVIRV